MTGAQAQPEAAGGAYAGVDGAPRRPTWVLSSLILVAAVANLNLTVALVALPEIGVYFNASQTALDLVGVGYSLGLAASVLYLGALGDRYGRKMMLVLGMVLSVPACLLAAYAPNIGALFVGRLVGGVSAGMAFPTTLAMITALWRGSGRTRSIALWSGIGGAISALGPMISGVLLERYWWGSVFLFTLPLAVIALVGAVRFVPSHVNETIEPVDHAGGATSMIGVAACVLAINFAPVPGELSLVLITAGVGVLAIIGFVWRQWRAANPLYDLRVAGRRLFWVAATGGIIVFGSLMGSMFVGQQYLQNVLGYSTLESGLAIAPAAVFMVLVAPHSARLVDARGSRFALLLGYTACLLGFAVMLLTWTENASYWWIALGYSLIGVGVGLAGTPASHALTGSVPVTRAGMASGTADLQRDLGGAVMQSILGALLTAGYASAFASQIANAPNGDQVSSAVQSELEKSFAGAQQVAERYPQYADAIISAAKQSFLSGDAWAYSAGIVAIVLGIALVAWRFPGREGERSLLAAYQAVDTARPGRGSGAAAGTDPAQSRRRPSSR